ncbi:hypothetical protein HMP09_2927 [Sphingomonas sp. HMP9]|uniref:PilZ domain-containing protein n=1 Tax=Sphingomonas sp. HMP9 TaxID=1517554 RepID=UPI0015965B96|nr:PilZ domain-containing protein [Sphingomonas sp. HMP9]BCA63693.1 hypothetical protein HMP09_2927 [Sphingomonas sp. HMP9]
MKELSVPCRMNVGGKWSSGCIHELSDKGMLVSSSEPPPLGTYVEIRRGTLIIIGRVVWNGGSRFGVRTQDPISLAALLSEPVLDRRQKTIDRRSAPRSDSARRTVDRSASSRHRSSAFEFLCIVALGAGVAGFAAVSSYHALSAPLAATVVLLDGAAQ